MPTDTEDSDDDYSIASAPLFSPPLSVASTSQTSHDISMRSASPAPSVWSISSSFQSRAFKHEYGRGLNNYSEVYRLPADQEELDRLDKQHLLFQRVMGKYPPPLAEVMADDVPGETKACLDLGCGSGSWIMDVARDFPHCSAVAVDLVPMQSPNMPPNCRSEVDDINLGLEHFYGDFDVVHARLISSGIKDYHRLVDQISRVLRPGGLVNLLEFDFHMYDANFQRIDLETSIIAEPWWPRWLAFVELSVRNAGGDVEAATHLDSWLRNHGAFEDVVYKDFWIPSCPWIAENPFQLYAGTAMGEDIVAFIKSSIPLLLSSGVPPTLVYEVQEKAETEIREGKSRNYVRLQYIYARKKHTSS